MATYLDKFPNCLGCPVEKYCGTVISATRLCQSLNDDIANKESSHVLTLSQATPKAALEESEIEGRLTLWDNITD